MAEGIQIPSPSAFLSQSPPRAPDLAAGPLSTSPTLETGQSQPRPPASAESSTKQKSPPAKRKSVAAPAGVEKPKQSKSRNGCQTCKAKRLKCDEEKPGCQQCKKRGVICGGYKKEFRWRAFEDSIVKSNIDRQIQLHANGSGSGEASTSTSPTRALPGRSGSPTTESAHHKKDSVVNDGEAASAARPNLPRPSLPSRSSSSPHSLPTATSNVAAPPAAPSQPRPSLSLSRPLSINGKRSADANNADRPNAGPVPRLSPATSAPSPTITEILGPYDHIQNNNAADPGLPSNFSPPGALEDGLNPPGLLDGHLVDDELEEILRNLHPPMSLPNSPIPQHLPVSDHLNLEDLSLRSRNQFNQTGNPHDITTLNGLLWHFLYHTAGIRSIMDGPTENPWRTFVWPLAQQSPALTHALAAMAAFHVAFDADVELNMADIGREHKQASLLFLREGLHEDTMKEHAAIATALALGFAESWENPTKSGNTHIKGAQALVKSTLEVHRRQPLSNASLSTFKFLINAWVYMDVIARLTAVDSDDSNDFDTAFLMLPGSPSQLPNADPGFGINFGMPVDARLDPFMGCANTLFPLIGRVANLVRKVCRSQDNSANIISQARDLKRALETWEPPVAVNEPEDPACEVEHCVQTAEAYRWATLLHLHEAVPELPSPSSVDLAQRVLQYLATIHPDSQTTLVQTYPLMAAGCAVESDEDKEWVMGRWARVIGRVHLDVLNRCREVTEEVWRRRDHWRSLPPSRRRLVATANLYPTRRKPGQPSSRNDRGGWDNLPGHTGIVFSFVDPGPEAGSGSARGMPSSSSSSSSSGNMINGMNRSGDGTPRSASPSMHGPFFGPPPMMAGPGMSMNEKPPRPGNRITKLERNMDPAYTVRGHVHWVGVMWDWCWEILLV